MEKSSRPIQARVTIELFPRDGLNPVPQSYIYDFYSLDSRLLILSLRDYLLPVSEAVDRRNCTPRSDIGSCRDPFIHFPDRQPASYSEIYLNLEHIRHLILTKLPDPQPRLF